MGHLSYLRRGVEIPGKPGMALRRGAGEPPALLEEECHGSWYLYSPPKLGGVPQRGEGVCDSRLKVFNF